MKEPETFLEFCTRQTGFGRTGWVAFGVIYAFVIAYVAYTIFNYPQPGWWIPSAFALAITVIVVVGTYGNYRLDRDRQKQKPNLNHYPDLCEGCDPVRMADGSPVTDFHKWYAATRKVDRALAWDAIRIMDSWQLMAAQREHEAYLDQLSQKP